MREVETPILILASGSPRRRELIASFGLPWQSQTADVDETVPVELLPDLVVERLSIRKAHAVRRLGEVRPGTVVIGSDTIVVLDGRILGKPVDREEAYRMLRLLAGRKHRVYTGLACLSGAGSSRASSAEAMERMVEPAEVRGGLSGIAAGRQQATKPDTASDVAIREFGEVGQYRVFLEEDGGLPDVVVGHTVSEVTFRPMSDEEIWAYIDTEEPMDKAGSYGAQGLGAVFIEKIEGDFYSIMGLPLNLLYQMLLTCGIRPLPRK